MKKLNRLYRNKKVKDITLSVVASIILTFSTQIVAFPLISRMVSINEYGIILTLSAVMNILAITFGNTLNNTRLLKSDLEISKKEEVSFNMIFIFLTLINTIILFFIFNMFFNIDYLTICLLILSSNFLLCRAYYTVEYRLNLNFQRVFTVSLLTLLGYIIGSIVGYIFDEWSYIFYIGEMIPCLYILLNSKILRVGFSFNDTFVSILNNFLFLVVAAFLITLITYLDRFIINPLLGAEIVSVFVVSSFLGKTIGILLGPIAGVLLSYYVKEDKVNLIQYYKRILINLIVTTVCFIGILVFGKSLIYILYPDIFPHIDKYYFIANLGAVLYVYGNLIQPSLLVNTKPRITTIIQIVYFIIYIFTSFLLIKYFDLFGFCFAIIFSNIFRIILMIIITHQSIQKTELIKEEIDK